MDHRYYGIKDMRQGEKIVAVVRHHWFVFFRSIIGILLLFFVPFLVLPIVLAFIAQGGGVAPAGFGFFFGSLWALFLWHLLFARWTDYYFDVWIITSDRVIDIDQKGFFRRNTATLANYEHVEDVSFELEGIFGNILNFGHVQVQTAGAKVEFIMEEVANPQKLERLIREAIVANEERGRVMRPRDEH